MNTEEVFQILWILVPLGVLIVITMITWELFDRMEATKFEKIGSFIDKAYPCALIGTMMLVLATLYDTTNEYHKISKENLEFMRDFQNEHRQNQGRA